MRGPLAILVVAALHSNAAECPALHKIVWPAEHPVWSLCWVSPDESAGIDGSGLELYDVTYNGTLVLKRAGVPLINVDYDPGGCGSYRDWQHTLMAFEADHPIGPPGSRFAESTRLPRTMCDHPGVDAGDFEGVAVWKTPEQLLLITQLQAGPYRYVHKWIFHRDGTIDARVAFTSRLDPCNEKPHNHHAYWRFEVARAVIEESAGSQWKRFRVEAARRYHPAGSSFRVRWPSSGRSYELYSSPENGVADHWAKDDFWALAFHAQEIDDGGAREGPGGSAVQVDHYVNGERLDGSRPVVWMHATDRHDGTTRCHFVGPTLRPLGRW